ncbi:MAG: LacI family DNA-binding transcriptional regulator [Bacteroidota bacterium]
MKSMTIRELAKRAGVSIATVSNALNGTGKLSEQTRSRILKLVEETGYELSKKALKSKSLGVAIPLGNLPHHWETFLGDNPYYHELIAGIEEAANKLGFDALLSVFHSEEELESWLAEKKIAGLLFLGRHPARTFEDLSGLSLPVVLIDAASETFCNVGIDDREGAYLATRHLLELGHRRIAFAESVAHPLECQQPQEVQHQRLEGYRRALAEFGVEFREELLFGDRLSPEGGYRIGKRLLSHPLKPTGVFTTADILALGMYRAFHEKGKRIPEEFSVVGFDNISLSAFLTPGLTTVEQNMREKGATAVQLLIDQIEAGKRFVKHLELPVRLIIRESTAPPC